MRQYLDIVQKILDIGVTKEDRTGTGTRSVAGCFFEHDMSEGFPLLTTKRVPFNLIASELEFFIHGITDKKWLQDRGNHIWDEWCSGDKVPYGTDDDTKAKMLMERDLGPLYGFSWRNFGGSYKDYKSAPVSGGVDQFDNMIKMLKTNSSDRRMIVMAWNPMDNHRMALPPCFKGNSLVLTDNGYKRIKDIVIGDSVYSDDGRYHNVYDTQKTEYIGDIVEIKHHYSNIALKTTPNHEHFTQRGLVEAKDITLDDFVSITIDDKSIIPSISYKQKVNQYQETDVTIKLDNIDDWYVMGYWLGDGWFRHDRRGVVFAVANKDIDSISERFGRTDIKTHLFDKRDNVSKLYNQNDKWYYIMKCFRGGSKTKMIPQWVFDAPIEYIEMFLEGYCDADGCDIGKSTMYTTISPCIAYGIQRLYIKLHKHISIYYQQRPKKGKICDRAVNQNNTFCLTSRNRSNGGVFYIKDGRAFIKVKEVMVNKNDSGYVYNLSVDDSHSYTVNNINTHNCHYAFQVTVTDNKLNLMWNQRSVDTMCGLPFNIASYALLLHLIAKETGYGEGRLCGFLADTHIYNNHMEQTNLQLTREPRSLCSIKTDNWMGIYDWIFTDTTVVNYEHHKGIKFDIAV